MVIYSFDAFTFYWKHLFKYNFECETFTCDWVFLYCGIIIYWSTVLPSPLCYQTERKSLKSTSNVTLLNRQMPAQHGSTYHLWSKLVSRSATNELPAWLHCVCRTHSPYGNVMYDRRVVRGNTYAQHIIPTVSMKHPFYCTWRLTLFLPFYLKNVYYHLPFDRRLSRTLLKYRDNRRSGGKPLLENEPGSSTDPILLSPCRAGSTSTYKQVSHNIFTIFNSLSNVLLETQAVLSYSWPSDRYLEELSNIIVSTNIECQTDAFLDRPPSPLFIPAKSGRDVETQIEEGEVGDPSGRSGHPFHT